MKIKNKFLTEKEEDSKYYSGKEFLKVFPYVAFDGNENIGEGDSLCYYLKDDYIGWIIEIEKTELINPSLIISSITDFFRKHKVKGCSLNVCLFKDEDGNNRCFFSLKFPLKAELFGDFKSLGKEIYKNREILNSVINSLSEYFGEVKFIFPKDLTEFVVDFIFNQKETNFDDRISIWENFIPEKNSSFLIHKNLIDSGQSLLKIISPKTFGRNPDYLINEIMDVYLNYDIEFLYNTIFSFTVSVVNKHNDFIRNLFKKRMHIYDKDVWGHKDFGEWESGTEREDSVSFHLLINLVLKSQSKEEMSLKLDFFKSIAEKMLWEIEEEGKEILNIRAVSSFPLGFYISSFDFIKRGDFIRFINKKEGESDVKSQW